MRTCVRRQREPQRRGGRTAALARTPPQHAPRAAFARRDLQPAQRALVVRREPGERRRRIPARAAPARTPTARPSVRGSARHEAARDRVPPPRAPAHMAGAAARSTRRRAPAPARAQARGASGGFRRCPRVRAGVPSARPAASRVRAARRRAPRSRKAARRAPARKSSPRQIAGCASRAARAEDEAAVKAEETAGIVCRRCVVCHSRSGTGHVRIRTRARVARDGRARPDHRGRGSPVRFPIARGSSALPPSARTLATAPWMSSTR